MLSLGRLSLTRDASDLLATECFTVSVITRVKTNR